MPPTRSCQHQRYATSLASCLVVLAVPAGVILEVIISKSMASLVLEAICEDVCLLTADFMGVSCVIRITQHGEG